MVTKNAKNPEAAARFIDFFLSPEGEILDFFGVEGNTMEFRDGVPYLTDEAYRGRAADTTGFAHARGVRIFDMMMNQKYNWERYQEDPERQQNRAFASKYAFDGTIQVVTLVDPLSDAGILLADVQANIVSQLTKIMMEPDQTKIPGLVNSLLAEYERKGLAKLEAEWTRQYLEKLTLFEQIQK
jgi:putative aldouronate transport system substrate-binding protein